MSKIRLEGFNAYWETPLDSTKMGLLTDLETRVLVVEEWEGPVGWVARARFLQNTARTDPDARIALKALHGLLKLLLTDRHEWSSDSKIDSIWCETFRLCLTPRITAEFWKQPCKRLIQEVLESYASNGLDPPPSVNNSQSLATIIAWRRACVLTCNMEIIEQVRSSQRYKFIELLELEISAHIQQSQFSSRFTSLSGVAGATLDQEFLNRLGLGRVGPWVRTLLLLRAARGDFDQFISLQSS